MALVDKKCIQQILGCLLKHPQYLSEVDKYNLTLNDFPSKFERYIFGAIQGLYYKGAQRISAFDVENYLSSNDVSLKLFNSENGIEYLQDVEEYSNEENFPYYYKKLKKLNLLNDFKKQGFDISDFYIEDLLDPRSLEVNQVFEQLEVQDIVLGMKKKLLKLETEYVKTDEVQSWNAADEVDEIVDNFGNPDEVGLPIQGHIINKVINGAERGALTIRSAPSGVGKTLLATTLAKLINENNIIRLDMSEFSESHSVSKIVGSPPGYVGYDESHNIFEDVRDKGAGVIILDEIEKAHPSVINLFLQILDNSTLKDSKGRVIHFNNYVIIMTSNVGFEKDKVGFNHKVETSELKEFFSLAFINRIDNIIRFNYLTEKEIIKIIDLKLSNLKNKYKNRGIKLKYSSKLKNEIIKNIDFKLYGARKIDKYIKDHIENKLIDEIIENKGEEYELSTT